MRTFFFKYVDIEVCCDDDDDVEKWQPNKQNDEANEQLFFHLPHWSLHIQIKNNWTQSISIKRRELKTYKKKE